MLKREESLRVDRYGIVKLCGTGKKVSIWKVYVNWNKDQLYFAEISGN